MSLAEQSCIPGKVEKLIREQIEDLIYDIAGWQETGSHIQKIFQFEDFKSAMVFVNKVADLAEAENHHPDIAIHYNQVELTLWTHSVDGLSMNDFILAAKIDQI